ncbi:MAG: cyclase family protein, partial [Gemmatimonadota bacterium]|nr:cyclase family protein [Gemmatimonadota bacterium]
MRYALVVVIAALGCAGAPEVPPVDLSRVEFVDLSHALDSATLYWPTSPSRFRLERLAYGPTPAGFFYAANTFAAPEHGGTHLDAPIHFHAGGLTADRLPLERLIAPAVVIDVAARAAADPDYRLTTGDVEAFELAHGPIAA